MTERKQDDKTAVDTHQITPDPGETPKKGTRLERERLAREHPAEDDPKTKGAEKDKNVKAGNRLKVGVDPTLD